MTDKKNRVLGDLIERLEVVGGPPDPTLAVAGIQRDSRLIEEGDLFVALPGTKMDGHDFIQQAVSRGAGIVLGSQPGESYRGLEVPYLQVPDSREALARLAAAWYGYPGEELVVMGVTGTDGKTTTVNLIYQILKHVGRAVGMISTVKAVIGKEEKDTGFHVTTPEALKLQEYLAQMVRAGLTHVVIEATSHGLAQKRVSGCEFDLGVVTNITHEHLDFHQSQQAYFEAKASLFSLTAQSGYKEFIPGKLAVLNRDDSSYPGLKTHVQGLGLDYVTYGTAPEADLRGELISQARSGIKFNLTSEQAEGEVFLPLAGKYNLSNALAAAATCLLGLGVEFPEVQQGISSIDQIPGRMERIDLGQKFTAVVDFAHTPNALKEALVSTREFTEGRIIAVFGSAGLRDKAKRRMMADISGELADLTIVTAEDPRTEDLADILDEMADGIEARGGKEGKTFWKVADRGRAIRQALELAGEGDTVIICGKGHEQSMCFGEVEYAWDDRTAVRAALADHLGQEGPEMPYLPTQD